MGKKPYQYDSDGDGVADGRDKHPLQYDNTLYETLAQSGVSVSSGYQMSGVIMWADNQESLVKGGVTIMPDGSYRFTNFKGWVKFPEGTFAYKYVNGVHSFLNYKEREQAWKIDEDCIVVLTDTEPKSTYQFSFFGSKSYLADNGFSKFLSALLPNKGFITCQELWLDDTFIDVSAGKVANITKIDYDPTDYSRFSFHTNYLKDLVEVYDLLDNDNTILTSLFSSEYGESIVQIYGYTAYGDLLACSPDNSESRTVLKVYPSTTKELNENGIIVSRQWFDFEGAGFNSKNGDTISFFCSSVKSQDELLLNDTNAEMVEKEPIKEEGITPENGIFKVEDKTYYYIDHLPVINQFIGENADGILEICNITDSGAFYVDQNGQKLTGKVVIDNDTYIYGDRFFWHTFVVPSGDTFVVGNVGNHGALYVDQNGKLVYGWFTASNGLKYYASLESGEVQKRKFVYTENNALRFLDESGQIATGCLIEIGGIEIMIDKAGDIINKDYAVNIIRAYMEG